MPRVESREVTPAGVELSSSASAILVLRVTLGLIWTGNLFFVLLPSNDFFGGFGSAVTGLGGGSLVGPELVTIAVQYSPITSIVVAGTTGYLALAFLLGASTRLACLIGIVFSGVLLVLQWGSTFVFPGGTDVGPHPLYIAASLALLIGRAESRYSLDAMFSRAMHRASSPAPSGPSRPGLPGQNESQSRRPVV